jgi:hypothetical protein
MDWLHASHDSKEISFRTADLRNSVPVSVNVTNVGARTGDEVVFAYMYPEVRIGDLIGVLKSLL